MISISQVTGREAVRLQDVGSEDAKIFAFDHVFDADATQEDIFNIILPLLDNALSGQDSAVLAYGQTGSGKSFTIGTTSR